MEPVLGLVDRKTGFIYLVERDETGIYKGRIKGRRIRLVQQQSGKQPVVAILNLRKVRKRPRAIDAEPLITSQKPPPMGFISPP